MDIEDQRNDQNLFHDACSLNGMTSLTCEKSVPSESVARDESFCPAQAGDAGSRPLEGTRSNKRDGQKDSAVCIRPPYPDPSGEGMHEAARRRLRFSQLRRGGSSIRTLPAVLGDETLSKEASRDRVNWLSIVSDDSAIDVSMFTASVSFQSDGKIEEETVLKAEDSFDTASEITPRNRVCYPRTENERSDTDKNATKANQVDLSFQMAVKGPERNWSPQLDEMGPKTIEIGWSLQLDKVGSQTNRTGSSLQMDEVDPQTNPKFQIDEAGPQTNPNCQIDEVRPQTIQTDSSLQMDEMGPETIQIGSSLQMDEIDPQTNASLLLDKICRKTNPNFQIDEVSLETNQTDLSLQMDEVDPQTNPKFQIDEAGPQTNPNYQIDEVRPQTIQTDSSLQLYEMGLETIQIGSSLQMDEIDPQTNSSLLLDKICRKTNPNFQIDEVSLETNQTDLSLQMDEMGPQTNPSLHIDEVYPTNPNFQTDDLGPQTNPNFEMDEVCPQTNPNCQIDEVCPQTNQGDPSFQIAQFDTEFNGLHPVRFLRRLFRWLCFCNHTSEIDTDKEALTNPGFSTEDADESSHSVALSGEPESGSVFSGSSSCPDDGGSSNQSTIMEEIQHIIVPKEDLLELFDKMCQEAKEMNINVVGRVVQIFNFAAAMLDSRGGFLSIDALGVHLYIPPGAIPVEELSQRVYVYVQGGLTSGGNYLTPYVHCGPSGFHFSKDVFLILPHCAKEAVGTEFSCIKSTSSGLQKLEGGKDGTLLVKTKSVLMTMSHFCGLAAYGSPSVKFMVACVFIKGMPNGRLMVRVRLFDDTKANFQEVKTVETKNGFNQVDMREHLEVRRCDPGKDIKMSMCSDVHSWEITEPERGWQTIQHSILWREYGPENLPSLPSKIFQASVCAASQTEAFQGRLKIFQEGREDHSVDFIVNFSPNAVKPRSPEQATEERIREICRQQILEQLRGPSCSETRLLDEDIMNKLCSLLDDISPIGRDWRMLPENLTGLKSKGHSWVESIEIRTASWPFRSPTEFVLDAFFAASRESKIGERCTLEELKKGLLSLSRLDIHFAIQAITDKLKQVRYHRVTSRVSCSCSLYNLDLTMVERQEFSGQLLKIIH